MIRFIASDTTGRLATTAILVHLNRIESAKITKIRDCPVGDPFACMLESSERRDCLERGTVVFLYVVGGRSRQ